MATYSSILAWRIPWTEEAGGTQLNRLSTMTLILMTKGPSPTYTELAKKRHDTFKRPRKINVRKRLLNSPRELSL